MLVLACVLLAALLVPLTGGRLSALARVPWRARLLLPAALVVQVVTMQVPAVPDDVAAAAHLATYAAAAWFLVANRRVAGLWLLGLGAACNGVTIALNGGTLPASASARETAGLASSDGFANSAVLADPVLPWLGDVFAVPAWVPFANVYSVGDVLVVVGAAWFLHVESRRGGRLLHSPGDILPGLPGTVRPRPRADGRSDDRARHRAEPVRRRGRQRPARRAAATAR